MNDHQFSTDHQPTTSTKKRLTVDQRIALLEKKLAVEREAKRTLENGLKFVVGGMMLSLAETDPVAKKRLIELIEKHVTRTEDLKRTDPLVARYKQELGTVGQVGKK